VPSGGDQGRGRRAIAWVRSSVDALKQLDQLLEADMAAVAAHVDTLVPTLTLQMRLSFASAVQSPDMSRLCKHLVNVLFRIFSAVSLAVGRDPRAKWSTPGPPVCAERYPLHPRSVGDP